jgi:pyridoxal phosphate phosphatase PHOSPHO2
MAEEQKKLLLLFDFDNTIIDGTSTYILRKEFLTDEEFRINKLLHETDKNWIKYDNEYLKLFKQHGVTLEKMEKVLDEKAKLTEGMQNLFDFIKENKVKFDLVLLTSTFEYVIHYLLKHFKIFDLFTELYCEKSEMGKPGDDQLIYIVMRKKHNCKDCGPSSCKNSNFEEYCENHDMSQYSKTLFVCDGKNDLCLAKHLKKNDAVFVRKGHGLHEYLFNKGNRNDISGEVIEWSSGKEIVEYLKKII